MVDKLYDNGKLSTENTKMISQNIQHQLEAIRKEYLHPILHNFVIDSNSRDRTVLYFAEIIRRNEKRSQLQTDEKVLLGDGFMVNLLSVLQILSVKIKLDKVDEYYPFHPESLISTKKDDTRLKFTSNEVEKWIQNLNSSHEWQTSKFSTQCFFLTLQCHHISVIPCLRKYSRRIRAVRELTRFADELSQSESMLAHIPALAQRHQETVKKYKEQIRRLNKAKICAEAGLIDERFLGRTLQFYNQFIGLLLKSIGCSDHSSIQLPLPSKVPEVFAAYPEWYVEDIAEFLLFVIQYCPNVVENNVSQELIVFLIVFVCSPQMVNNPYLIAKLVEVLFVSSPTLHHFTQVFHTQILSHKLAEEHLARSLMKFYADVEQTGASSEFYDKFTIRYHISIIMKSLWTNATHKYAIIKESNNGNQFVKFINMLMNDTTFLLDESLESLKRIHEIQEEMKDTKSWNKSSREHQQSRQRQLASDERQCRSYLTLASETVDMFHYLTKDIKEPFLRPVSCTNIKVF